MVSMHIVSHYNVSEVARQCFWGRGTEKYGQRAVFAHGWIMMCTTLDYIGSGYVGGENLTSLQQRKINLKDTEHTI